MADHALTFVEIDVPYCSLLYGVAPCTAAIGVTGAAKCFNSLGTCQDRPNFTDVPATMRFAKDASYLVESGIEHVAASIEGVTYAPARISLGEDLGQRASVTVTFKDHRFSDTGTGFDKYLADRPYNPFEQGTFWGKFRARHPYLRGRKLRLIQGVLGEALGDMDTRHFLIESFEGPSLDGEFTITAKDALKQLDGDRAQAPVASNGRLSADITNVATTATLTPAGIGNTDYPASGYLNIGGKEIVAFTRSSDTLTLTRARFDTVAVAHQGGDRCQICLYYLAQDPADVIEDLETNYAAVDPDYIPLTNWQAETENYYRRVVTALIAEPTSVKKLVTELIQEVGLATWWDESAEQQRLQVLRSIATDAEFFDDSNIVEGSFSVQEQPDKRVTQVWTFFGLKTPLSPLGEPSSYRSSALTADLDAEENDGSKVKKIFSRWIPFGGLTAAQRVNDIQLGRFVNAPRLIKFRLFRRGAETPELGEGIRVESMTMQDAAGEYANVPAQIVKLRPGDDVWEVEAEEQLFVEYDETDLSNKTITIDANVYSRNARTMYDALYPAPEPGDVVKIYVSAGIILGALNASGPALDIGSWPTVAATGNRTNLSPVISSLSINTTTEGITPGMFVRGTGITPGTKVLTVDSTSQVTLDANAFSTGTGGALTFYTVMIELYVRGRIQGGGGSGGDGGKVSGQNGFPGQAGGTGVYTRYPLDLFLDVGDGDVWGGGGGGGGQGTVDFGTITSMGGSSGAGYAPGAVGLATGASPGSWKDGNSGTTTTGGARNALPSQPLSYGGAGGDPGLPGEAGAGGTSGAVGGAAGAGGTAIDGVSYVKKTGTGDIRGSETN